MRPRTNRLFNLILLAAVFAGFGLGPARVAASVAPAQAAAQQAPGEQPLAFVRRIVSVLTERLGLTESQQAQVAAIINAERAEMEPLIRQLMAAQEQVRALYADGRFDGADEAQARAILTGQRQTFADLLFIQVRVARQIYSVLTPAQRELLGRDRAQIEQEIAGLFTLAGVGGSLQETLGNLAARLGLTAEQQFRALLIVALHAPGIDTLQRQFAANQGLLWEAVLAPQFDERAVRNLAAQQGQVLADLLAGVEVALLQFHTILTPRQRALIEQERDLLEARLRHLFSLFSIDEPRAFAYQHYVDFLGREPDAAGLAFWTGTMTACGADARCAEVRRVNTSAAFFLSIEFQQTGYLAYKTHKAAFGDMPGKPVPLRLSEFQNDTGRLAQGLIVGQGDWQGRLEANKLAYFQQFVAGARFAAAYPASMTAAEFVDSLNRNAGGVIAQAERDALAAGLAAGTLSRAAVLRRVAESEALSRAEFNRAFVLMQYFGYLRRDPDSGPDPDYSGFEFWLNQLNRHNGNYVTAELVKAFILSLEYRRRFGQ